VLVVVLFLCDDVSDLCVDLCAHVIFEALYLCLNFKVVVRFLMRGKSVWGTGVHFPLYSLDG
jgi:hypothetical protein